MILESTTSCERQEVIISVEVSTAATIVHLEDSKVQFKHAQEEKEMLKLYNITLQTTMDEKETTRSALNYTQLQLYLII